MGHANQLKASETLCPCGCGCAISLGHAHGDAAREKFCDCGCGCHESRSLVAETHALCNCGCDQIVATRELRTTQTEMRT